MNILVPLNNLDHLDRLLRSGANEFYMGFNSDTWSTGFSEFDDLNRMSGFERAANRYSMEEMPGCIQRIHECGALIYITFNAAFYSEEQHRFVAKQFDALKEADADGVIVSDPILIRAATNRGLFAVASTMCGIYNTDVARYYIGEGAKRIILPRDISLSNIKEITATFPDTEFEVFLMRSGCKFADCYCLGFHRLPHGAFCENIRRSTCSIGGTGDSFSLRQTVSLNEICYQSLFENGACGLCALYRLLQMNVRAGKIVGRAEHYESVLRDIKIVKNNLEIAEQCQSESEYLARMNMPEHRDTLCFSGASCYYPDVRFDRVMPLKE